jgi:hypothetical protein
VVKTDCEPIEYARIGDGYPGKCEEHFPTHLTFRDDTPLRRGLSISSNSSCEKGRG